MPLTLDVFYILLAAVEATRLKIHSCSTVMSHWKLHGQRQVDCSVRVLFSLESTLLIHLSTSSSSTSTRHRRERERALESPTITCSSKIDTLLNHPYHSDTDCSDYACNAQTPMKSLKLAVKTRYASLAPHEPIDTCHPIPK